MQPFSTPLTAIKPGRFGSFTILMNGITRAFARKIKGGHYVVSMVGYSRALDYTTGLSDNERDEAINYALSVLWNQEPVLLIEGVCNNQID